MQGVPAPPPPPLHPQTQWCHKPHNSHSKHQLHNPTTTSNPTISTAPAAPQAPQQMVHLKGSNFKPEYSGKPDENAEAHLLHTNDWMNAHHSVEGVKVQRFCLTQLGEVRLWYHSLEPINVDWQGIQNLFRQQYS